MKHSARFDTITANQQNPAISRSCRLNILISRILRIWAIFLAWLGIVSSHAQVINFDVPGGAGATNFFGQGVYAEPANNFWNPVLGGGTTSATNLLSDGVTHSPITLTSQLGGTFGTQGAQGTPAALQQPYQYNNAVRRTNTLNNVPAGTYDLYLYGINNTGTRGTTFTVSTPAMGTVTGSTVNTPGSLTRFTPGADYTVFRNVVLATAGTITFTWTGNPNVALAGNNEGDFNALQLVFVSSNTAVTSTPNLGATALVFDPSMPMSTIQSQLDAVFAAQQNNQFGPNRYVYFFKSGQYSNLDLNLGYYTQVIGLGQMPDDVVITGDVHSDGVLSEHNATINFWRACENLTVVPTNSGAGLLEAPKTMTWAVSQGTSLRRMHIKGNLNLSNTNGTAWSSGGFLADSKIDSTVSSRTQQQWLSRNDIWGNWSGQNWNMVFVGVSNPPAGSWPGSKFTAITNTPSIPEKPYLTIDNGSNYVVQVPVLRTNSIGTTWVNGPTPGVSIPLSQFYLAQPAVDNAGTINAALSSGLNLLFTPGIYHLTNTILVTRSDTIVMGIGYPTLIPTNGNITMLVSDVDGIRVSGLMFDAGTTASPALLQVGTARNSARHSSNPICLYDISSRVGGEFKGTTTNCVTVNANDVIGDNLWLWRADHGTGASPAWTGNPSNAGLEVNGDYVTMYGLFCEHHEKFQTVWNGNWGRIYFYQSELPYDAPSQAVWSHDGINGYASYKVADTVTSHQAYGLGVYGVFISSTTACFNAIETPTNSQQVNLHNMISVYITGQSGSQMTHIINGTGATLTTGVTTATANSLWLNPSFGIGSVQDGANLSLSVPTESWHLYQLQYKNDLNDSNWLSFGNPFRGDDTLDLLSIPISAGNRLFRIKEN
jgi:hypothetical protein